MFGKSKGSSHEKDRLLPPAPQLAPASLTESDSTEISSIGPGMTVVGKISSEGTLNVFGRVEGELRASVVRISDGAQVEGAIAAQELTIGGRFKGTIQANRVTLTSSAVVEGEIFHRLLAIEENAWFAGVSRPAETISTPRRPLSRRIRGLLFSMCRPTETGKSTARSIRRCMPILRLGESQALAGFGDPVVILIPRSLSLARPWLTPSNAYSKRCGSRPTTQCSTTRCCCKKKSTRGRRRLLAPLSRQRLLIGMGHKGARSVKPMLWCGP